MTDRGQELRVFVGEAAIELVRHSVAEEQYLYPAVREHVRAATGSRTRRSRITAGSRNSSSSWSERGRLPDESAAAHGGGGRPCRGRGDQPLPSVVPGTVPGGRVRPRRRQTRMTVHNLPGQST
ncbi:hypothetical protein ACWERW_36610 [Streptomyces sp. NPDC004012]